MKISFWCEYPKKVDWKKVTNFLRSINLKTEVFIAVKSKKEFLNWKKKIKSKNIVLIPWPLLPKSHGYWFSGFSSKKDIKELEEFKGQKIFIDAEPPLPKFKGPLKRFVIQYINLFFHNAKNFYFLKREVVNLCKGSKVMYSEFPFPHKIFKHLGIYINATDPRFNNNLEKVLGWYTTFFGPTFRFLLKPYLRHKAKQVIRLYGSNKVSFAVGLIGGGITDIDQTYKSPKQLEEDLQNLKNLGAKKVILYSLESLMKRKNFEEWKTIIKNFKG